MEPEFIQRIERLSERTGTYRPEAYFWVMRALEYTRRKLQRIEHVSGRELCEGARELALEEYGPMALDVLEHWGIRRTEDVGEIVFMMVEEELMRKTDRDSRADFVDVYDFRQAFIADYPW